MNTFYIPFYLELELRSCVNCHSIQARNFCGRKKEIPNALNYVGKFVPKFCLRHVRVQSLQKGEILRKCIFTTYFSIKYLRFASVTHFFLKKLKKISNKAEFGQELNNLLKNHSASKKRLHSY